MIEDQPEKKIGDLTVRIDREACIGSGNCIEIAPEAFQLDSLMTCAFVEPTEGVAPDRLIEACRVCPVGALIVLDAQDRQIVP